jgi:predicted P-loop ATPase
MSDLVKLESAKARRSRADSAPWLKDCLRDERGRVVANLANVLIALRSAPELVSAFAVDEMLCAPLVMTELPIAPGGEAPICAPPPRPARDEDVSQLQEFLQHNGLPKVGKDTAHQAVDQRARERAFHPVRRYLEELRWDRIGRLDHWMSDYLGADATDYTSRIGRMFIIAMVARVFVPGCKSDHVVVLEGDQGAGKSSACRVLAGEWFSDSLPDIRDKDGAQHIRGKWLIEIAELAAIGKAESETLKSFVSRQVDRYRPSYGRKEVTEPRQCVFIGTTNKSVYLKDETGGRRFWPVRVGKVNIERLMLARDQILAEAVAVYRAGERWWPDQDFERDHISPQQKDRFEADPWEKAISEYISPLSRVEVSEIAREALKIESVGRIGTADQRRIAAVLAANGWQPGRDHRGRFYARSHDA